MNNLFLTLILFFLVVPAKVINAQNVYDKVFKVADNIIDNTSFKIINNKTNELFSGTKNVPVSEEYKIESPYNEWKYWNGVLAIGMIQLSEISGDGKYKNYALKNYKFIFDNLDYFGKQYKKGFKKPSMYQYFEMGLLDHCGAMSAGLCDIYHIDSRKDYYSYLERAANYIMNDELRFDDGTLIRSWPREMTLWADDLYMSVPFLARMSKITGDSKYINDAILQIKHFNKYLFNDFNGLYFHSYYSDNKQNGLAHWGRCNGWVVMAHVELLKYLPDNHPEKENLINILVSHIVGLSRYQDYSGMWRQLIDKPDSYLESSSTAMFIYGIATAINEGWLDKEYAGIAVNGWKGLEQKIREDGQVEGICKGTGTVENIKYYYDRPTILNDIHGLGAILLAGAEMIKLDELINQDK